MSPFKIEFLVFTLYVVGSYLDPYRTPPWCWQSEVWSRSYVVPAAAGPQGWRGFARLQRSRKRLSCSGCTGSASSSSSPDQKPPAPSQASFPDDHLEEPGEQSTSGSHGSYICQNLMETWCCNNLPADLVQPCSLFQRWQQITSGLW